LRAGCVLRFLGITDPADGNATQYGVSDPKRTLNERLGDGGGRAPAGCPQPEIRRTAQ